MAPLPKGEQGVNSVQQSLAAIKWPKRAHPGALTKAGQERTPWLTRPELPLNKAACQCCLTWKDLAKQLPFRVNIFFKQVEQRQTGCDPFFMPLVEQK